MAKFRFRGKEYVVAEKYIIAEILFIEGKLKKDLDDFTKTEGQIMSVFIGIRRADPQLLSWEQMLQLDPGIDGDFEVVPESEEEDPPMVEPRPDPTVGGTAEALQQRPVPTPPGARN
jgi:hypothetical protein